MHRLKSEVLDDLAHAVVEMEEGKAVEIALEAVECGIDPYVALEALSKAMEMVAKKYENGEYFIPELIVCSDTLYAALEILKPHLGSRSAKSLGRAVIGVVEGDIHDLGRDVPLRKFLDESGKAGAHLICMSTLMTTSMRGIEKVIAMLDAEGVRERYKVMIGGGPVSQEYADRIGADGYAPNAAAAVKKAKELLAVRNTQAQIKEQDFSGNSECPLPGEV